MVGKNTSRATITAVIAERLLPWKYMFSEDMIAALPMKYFGVWSLHSLYCYSFQVVQAASNWLCYFQLQSLNPPCELNRALLISWYTTTTYILLCLLTMYTASGIEFSTMAGNLVWKMGLSHKAGQGHHHCSLSSCGNSYVVHCRSTVNFRIEANNSLLSEYNLPEYMYTAPLATYQSLEPHKNTHCIMVANIRKLMCFLFTHQTWLSTIKSL